MLPKADSGAYKGHADIVRELVKTNTTTSLDMTDATYNVLASNGDGFFASNRDKFSLYDKAKKIGTGEMSKNPLKYSSMIAEISRMRIFDITEASLDSGRVATIDYGESESGGLYYQIFYLGSTKVSKGDTIEMVGVHVNQRLK